MTTQNKRTRQLAASERLDDRIQSWEDLQGEETVEFDGRTVDPVDKLHKALDERERLDKALVR